ncbi:HD domain-containing protein [Phlyctochytrium arcticum]|nr:HD domain-containing protein [Phlyctochytrium arcticum]
MADPKGVLKFLHTIENLKRTKRTGWINNGIPAAESISDHMHRMGVMAFLLNDPSIDRTKCIKMAIVHDLAECIAGDITPDSGVTKEAKHEMERKGMEDLVQMLNGSVEAKEIKSLWEEYEAAESSEALFVKDLDKFEMIVQAVEYEKRHPEKNLDSFFASTKGVFQHPLVVSWVEELYAERRTLGNCSHDS